MVYLLFIITFINNNRGGDGNGACNYFNYQRNGGYIVSNLGLATKSNFGYDCDIK